MLRKIKYHSFAFAKVNLTLNVLRRLKSNFHSIESFITFIDLPRAAIATKAATTDIGIDNPIITVARHDLKNNIKINIANVPPIQIFCLTFLDQSMGQLYQYLC